MIARVPALLAAATLAFAASRADAMPPDAEAGRVTPAAVWTPPEGFVAAIHGACDAKPGDFGACFVAAMERAGAPPEALAFARRTGRQGYLAALRATGGRVDVAVAQYPFRANENAVEFLVNGAPPMLDIDDPRYLDPGGLAGNPAYAEIRRNHPNVAVFPGPRGSADGIEASPGPDGGQIFRVLYALTDGCHACARVGALRLDFLFDASGRFAGTRVASVRAGSP